MNHVGATKIALVTPPAAIVDNAAVTTGAIDTLGYDHLTIFLILGAIDIAPASSSIIHSDASNLASPATIATGGTDYDLATAADSDNETHIFEIDMRGKKRYVDFAITGGDGSAGAYFTVLAVLSKPQAAPVTAAQRGAEQVKWF